MAVKAVLPSAMLTLFAFARLGEAQVQDPIYIDTYQAYEFGAGQVINFDAGTGQPAYMLDQVRFGVYLRIRRKIGMIKYKYLTCPSPVLCSVPVAILSRLDPLYGWLCSRYRAKSVLWKPARQSATISVSFTTS